MAKDTGLTVEQATGSEADPAPARFLPAFVWRASRDGSIIYANPWAYRYLGALPDAVIGLNWRTFVHEKDVAAVLDAVRQTKDGPLLRNADVRLLRADGEFRWHTLHLQATRDQHGNIADTVGVAIDIHESRYAWALYEANERRLRAAFQAARMGGWEWNMKTHMVHMTAELAKIYALPEGVESATIEELSEHVVPEDREVYHRKLDEFLRRRAPFELDYRLKEELGPCRWLRMRGHPEYDAEGRLVRVYGVSFDISEQRIREEQLSQAQSAIEARSLRLRAAMQAAKLRIVTLDLSDWTLSRESAGDRHRIARMPYQVALCRVHADDRAALDRYVRRLVDGEAPRANFEFRIQHARREQWVSGSALLQRDDTGKPLRLIGSILDITARKRLELMLRESSRRKDEFLAMLAHELRNPLAPMRTAIALLQKSAQPDAREPDLLGLMQRQAEHMTRIVDDLLEVSRITQGRIALKHEPILVVTAVYHAVESVASLVEGRAQQIHVEVPDATSWICADATRMSQILVNILNNASKYTPEGGSIRITAQADAEWVSIVVADTGSGVSPELLPHIFDLFSQGERTLDRSEGGLGIGLSLVKKLVEMHDGRISVRSPGPGKGTSVTVDLPRLHHHERHSAAILSPLDAPRDASVRHILIVDDNRDAADSLAMLCETEDHVTRVAYSSAEALEAAQVFKPDVALLDIGLPGMDGYELAGALRAVCKAPLLLIAITGYGQAEDRIRAQAAGFDLHFVKPVNVESLLKSLSVRAS
ncbi:PAS domain-containing protein [Paraburkholderia sp. DHOC27]|uniref:PAS domain-containing protein n=1 Tax=Paraburkholderia sp. DHOC27 TaxID=2303330 RepID=UPI000E3E6C2A|nr:PAS domain-containing protein [Paraburkholderia sp. DHOC27]RFU48384.1 PAS domain S-box protein [Paraburkholderia sp. DHOC27]